MIIMFLRSSASTSNIVFKVCSETPNSGVATQFNSVVCTVTGTVYCIECMEVFTSCQCKEMLPIVRRTKLRVNKASLKSCKRVLFDSPHSGEDKMFKSLKYDKKIVSQRVSKTKQLKRQQKIITKQLATLRIKEKKRLDTPHMGFLRFFEEKAVEAVVADLNVHNNTDIDFDFDVPVGDQVSSMLADGDLASNCVLSGLVNVAHYFVTLPFSACNNIVYTVNKKYLTAYFLVVLSDQALRWWYTQEQIDSLRQILWKEIHVVRCIDMNAFILKPCLTYIKSCYNRIVPSASNVDVWACYVISVRESSSMVQFLAITYNFTRALGFSVLSPFIEKLFADVKLAYTGKITTQAGDETEFGFDTFISYFRHKFDFWRKWRNCQAIDYIVKLFSMLVSAGCCQAQNLNFEICGMKFFRDGFIKSLEKTKPAIYDVFDLCINCVDYFLNVGYLCFKHGSFEPLLFDNQHAYDMSQLHISITSNWAAIKDMAWEITPFDDDVDFQSKAATLVEYYKSAYKSLSRINIHEANILVRKQTEIEQYMVELTRLMLCGQLRHAPFGMLISGGSSVGKSTLTSILTTVSIIAQGGNPDASLRKVTNPNDEFFSNYTYGTEAIILDDMCNTKIAFNKKSPLEKIIEYINNVPAYPVMADLSSKGKIPLRPKVVVVTSNVDELDAGSYSNEPVSILRRFNIIIRVTVRKCFALNPDVANPRDYMLCKEKVSAHVAELKRLQAAGQMFDDKVVTDDDWMVPDIWDLRASTVISDTNSSMGGRAVVKYIDLHTPSGNDVFTISELQQLVLDMSYIHLQQQKHVVNNIKSVPGYLSNKYKHLFPHIEVKPQMDNVIDDDMRVAWREHVMDKNRFSMPIVSHLAAYFELDPLFDLRNFAGFGVTSGIWFTGMLSLPSAFIVSSLYWCVAAAGRYEKHKRFGSAYANLPLHFTLSQITTTVVGGVLIGCLLKWFWNNVRNVVDQTTPSSVVIQTKKNESTISYIKPHQFGELTQDECRMIENCTVGVPKPHSSLDPKTMEEFAHNASQKNVWSATVIEPIRTAADDTSTADHLLDVCKKNVALLRFQRKFVNCFFVTQNFMVVPFHFIKLLEKEDTPVLQLVSRPLHKEGVVTNNHTQLIRYSRQAWVHLHGTDLCVYYVTNCMPRKNVLKWMPEAEIKRSIPGRMVYRNPHGEIEIYSALLRAGVQNTGPLGAIFSGFSYMLEGGAVTADGMCMATWVSDTSPPSICAFHLGGCAGTPRGVAGSITSGVIDNAMSVLLQRLKSSANVGSDGYLDLNFGKSFDTVQAQYLEPTIAANHPANFLPPEANITVHGTAGGTHKYHTKVVYRDLGLKFLEDNGIPVQHGPPNMNKPPKWYHFAKNLAEFATPSLGPSLEALEWAVTDYVTPITSKLKFLGFGSEVLVRPLSNQENINGVNGVRFLDALKMNTAAGFPLKGKTENYIVGCPGEREFENPAVWEEVSRMEAIYAKGERCYPVFVAHLKDEPVSLGKDKVRVFFGNGTPFKLLVRKYWLPIARLLSENATLCECAIGINSHGLEWNEFVTFVETFPQDRCVAGDYKGYDQKEFLSVTQACYAIYIDIAAQIGYTLEELDIMSAMIPDLTTFAVLYFGALLVMSRGNASGQNMTSYVNSTANSLNSRCAYYDAAPNKPPVEFRKNVHMMTYGDDDIGTVNPACNWYTAQSKAFFLKEYGIEYTPPNKQGEHVRFYNTREVDFLKRKIVWIPEIATHLGALDYKSVLKSITCGIPSPNLSRHELFGQILDGGLTEMFAHGKDEYESFRTKVNAFVAKYDLARFVRTNHITFKERCEMWLFKYRGIEPETGYQDFDALRDSRLLWEMGIEHFNLPPDSVQSGILQLDTTNTNNLGARAGTRSIPFQNMGSTAALTPAEGLDSPNSFFSYDGRHRRVPTKHCSLHHMHPQYAGLSCSGATIEYWPVEKCGLCTPRSPLCDDNGTDCTDDLLSSISPLTPQSGVFPVCGYYDSLPAIPELLYDDGSVVLEAYASVAVFRQAYYDYYNGGNFNLPPPISDWYQDAFAIARRLKRRPPDKPQSGEIVNHDVTMESTSKQVITTFIDDTDFQEDGYTSHRDSTYYNVDTEEVSLAKFLSRPIKIASFVKTPNSTAAPELPVQISPSIFFSNKRVVNRLACYRNLKCDLCFRFTLNGSPFHYGRYMASVLPNAGTESFIVPAFLTNAANLAPAHALLSQMPHVFLNPTTGQGGCLKMPYLHQWNAFDTVVGDNHTMGSIILSTISPLKQLTPTAADPITITIFCWAENVVFGAPTQSNPLAIAPQSGDEYGKGVISKPLSVAAQVAGILASVKIIRPYALATQQVFSMGSRVATALGFSKPAIVSDIQYMVPRTYPNTASATQHDPIYKLTFDDKQEVTVDPGVVGLGSHDEMGISTLVQRPSLMANITWTGATQGDNVLNYLLVTSAWHVAASGAKPAIAMTPMCYLAQMFRQWRGSIRFRFVCVASSFHRGRLRITYDPNGFPTNLPAANALEHNTTYNYIWDISDSHEAVIDVGYMSNQPYCATYIPGVATNPQLITTTPTARNAIFDNGMLAISVVNDLTASGTSIPDAQILVFVSAGPDFELMDPVDNFGSYAYYPQSGEMMQDDIMTTYTTPTETFGKYISSTDMAPVIHHGDPPTSLRYILKRYTQYMYLPLPAIPANSAVAFRFDTSAFPLNKGRAPGGIYIAQAQPYNYVSNTPLAWTSAMFLARRGGLRVRFRDVSNFGVAISNMRAMRLAGNPAWAVSVANFPAGTAGALAKQGLVTNDPQGFCGFALASNIDGGKALVDCEIPYISPRRFASPRRGDNSLSHEQGVRLVGLASNTAPTGAKDGLIAMYVSAADDYSLQGFVCCPPVYYTPTFA